MRKVMKKGNNLNDNQGQYYRMYKIQCPYCHERISESVDECQSHCEEFHHDRIDKPLGKDFYLKDYWCEEVVFFTLRDILRGREEVDGLVEDCIAKYLPEGMPIRKRLLTLRLQAYLWPCTHEDVDPDNLDECCPARRRFGEFMNAMCDAYGSDDESDSSE